MAEAKKKTEKKEVKTTKKVEKKFDASKLSLTEARVELQKVKMKVMTGEESNTSKIKKIKKHIARLLTKESKN